MIIWGFPQIRAIHSLRFREGYDGSWLSRLRDPEEYVYYRSELHHNGYFKTLEEIVHFYNVRDVEDFPPAEYPETVNKDELGNLGLSQEEETAIVAFLRTLTDCIK